MDNNTPKCAADAAIEEVNKATVEPGVIVEMPFSISASKIAKFAADNGYSVVFRKGGGMKFIKRENRPSEVARFVIQNKPAI